jgi:tRNA(Arg) A34 adenosine deaminase TadA
MELLAAPDWAKEAVDWEHPYPSADALMAAAIQIAALSADNQGGPFGAVLADNQNRLVEIGWNFVVESHDSTHHAETHCVRRAQSRLATHDLGRTSLSGLALYSSCSPCVHCFGVIYWSGLKYIFAAASKEDAEAAGFDEGPLTAEMWEIAREKKGIIYTPNFCRDDAALEPFRIFARKGGKLY